ncbi:MAG: VWA domain-containing protein [Verrucomicrobiota bacterium]
MEFISLIPLWLLLPAALLAGVAWRVSLVDRPPAMRAAALVCRFLAMALLIIALCRPCRTTTTDKAHFVFLLDVSESVDPGALESGLSEIEKSLQSLQPQDTSTLAVYASQLRVLTLDEARKFVAEIKANHGDSVFRAATDLTGAMSSARLLFPADKSRRMVVLSDGAQEKSVAPLIARLHQEHTDVVFRRLAPLSKPEAAVLAVEAPSPVAFEGEIVRLKVRLASNRSMQAKLRITNRGVTVAEKNVTLTPDGETTERIDVEMTTSGETVWEADLLPTEDWFPINNRAATAISVRGKPRVLVIHERPQAMRAAERLLREQGIEFETRGTRGLPEEMRDLLAYDAIMLADVPATALNATQMAHLKSYVTDFGGGLVMMGSENTYGLGGYYKTPVEEVLPLVSRFEKEKEKPSLAMVLVLDHSGSMSGNPLALARQAARSAAELLSPQDQLAVISFDDQPTLVLDLTPAGNRVQIAAAIDSIGEGGGTNMQPAMVQARDILRGANAKIKHVIGLTDGQTPPTNLVQLCQEMADASMTVSTVAMGDGADRGLLAQMAEAGRGRYYETNAPENVPQIFTRETMQASRSAIKEDLYNAAVVSDHPVLNGFTSTTFPPVLGYVMSRPKPTAQVLLALESGDPLLAIGRYGIGTGVCCTADLTERWGGEWLAWGGCGKFWAQVLRGVLKRADSSGIEVKPTLTRDELLLDIRRTDDAARPLSGIHWQPNALDDTGKSRPVTLQETGVGRYQARVSIADTRQLTFRLHDTEHGNAKLLQWLRPCPAEYCLSTTIDPALASLTAFDPTTIRSNLSPVRLRSTLVPLCCFLSIAAMILGLVLRRI